MNDEGFIHVGRLTSGVMLVVLGGLFLFSELGVLDAEPLARYWPVVLIALGTAKLLQPADRRGASGRSSGAWLLAVGIWCLINTLELFGLSWGSSWPLFLIFAGGAMVYGALTGEPAWPRKEDSDAS